MLFSDSASAGSGENTVLDFAREDHGFKIVHPTPEQYINGQKTSEEQAIDDWRVLGSIKPEDGHQLTETEDLRTKIVEFFKVNRKQRKRYDRFLKYDFDFVRKMTTDIKLNLRALNSLLGEK